MILWTSKVTQEKTPAIERMGIRAWRWVLDVERWTIEAREEMRSDGTDWHPANRYARVDLCDEFRMQAASAYYDGEHRWVWIGWVQMSCGW